MIKEAKIGQIVKRHNENSRYKILYLDDTVMVLRCVVYWTGVEVQDKVASFAVSKYDYKDWSLCIPDNVYMTHVYYNNSEYWSGREEKLVGGETFDSLGVRGMYYSYSIKITESFNPEDGSLKERKAEILDLREEFKND